MFLGVEEIRQKYSGIVCYYHLVDTASCFSVVVLVRNY